MPLARGTIVGFDASRMTYNFTMMDGPHIIDCQISSVSLDDLAGQRWQTSRVPDRDAQFFGISRPDRKSLPPNSSTATSKANRTSSGFSPSTCLDGVVSQIATDLAGYLDAICRRAVAPPVLV